MALRGEEVLQEVTFLQAEIKKDPLLVTPIGICLNYYDQRNNFIMVRFNGERVKLYDNNKLTIVDVALQAGFPNEELFPKRGKALEFLVNGIPRIVRGEAGESAQVYMNGRPANINTPLEPNCEIYIQPSTMGGPAELRLEQLEEYTTSDVTFLVNDKIVRCPKFLEVNGSLEPPFYLIQEGDKIDTRSFYTVGQLAAFMDVELDADREIFVNNRLADLETLIYENFTIEWTVLSYDGAEGPVRFITREEEPEPAGDADFGEETVPAVPEAAEDTLSAEAVPDRPSEDVRLPAETEAVPSVPSVSPPVVDESPAAGAVEPEPGQPFVEPAGKNAAEEREAPPSEAAEQKPLWRSGQLPPFRPMKRPGQQEEAPAAEPATSEITVTINGQQVRLTGKKNYIFVDLFEFYEFDLKASAGRGVITKLNGKNAHFSAFLNEGDEIELGWQ